MTVNFSKYGFDFKNANLDDIYDHFFVNGNGVKDYHDLLTFKMALDDAGYNTDMPDLPDVMDADLGDDMSNDMLMNKSAFVAYMSMDKWSRDTFMAFLAKKAMKG